MLENIQIRAFFYQQIGQFLFYCSIFLGIAYPLIKKLSKHKRHADKVLFFILTALGLFIIIGDLPDIKGILMLIEMWLCIGFKAILFPSASLKDKQ